MYKNLIKKFPVKLCAAIVCSAVVYKNFGEKNLKPHYAAASSNYSRRFYPASAEYPELGRNKNLMSRNLTQNLYAKLRDLRTKNGYSIDDAIQTGVDNIGKFSSTGLVAGDEETYQIFKELFDKVILEKHNFKPDQNQVNDLDATKLVNGQFDPEYVLSVRIRTLRNLRGYCLPSFCTRGERRDIESILVKSLYDLDNEYKGVYYSLKDVSKEEEATLMNNNVWMERPFLTEDLSSNLARDWPDSRGLWMNNDKSLIAFINRRDHILLSSIQSTSDITETFTKFSNFVKNFESQIIKNKWEIMHNKHLGYITTDPKDLGTALKLSVRIKLENLAKDGRLSAVLKMLDLSQVYRIVSETQHVNKLDEEDDRLKSILEISSKTNMGQSEVQIAQDFIHSIHKLIEIEKNLKNNGTLDDFLYQK